MSRVAKLFKRLRKDRRCGVIAYITCGDPDAGTTIRIIEALQRAGADAIELGIPFSDPIADGPVIQAASQRALKGGTTVRDVFAIARPIPEQSEIPLIAFSYITPILRYTAHRFAADAELAGIDAMLLTDLPPEDATEIRNAIRAHRIGGNFLLAPTSSDAPIAALNITSPEFIYYDSARDD